MRRALLLALVMCVSCGPRKVKAVVTVGAYTGDRVTWVDGKAVKYEVAK